MLESRKGSERTAGLLSAGANGFVQAWSVHQRGGLVGRFMAGNKSDESILALASNKDNSVLITGDSGGYLKIYDISDYCLQKESDKTRSNSIYQKRASMVDVGSRRTSIQLLSNVAFAKKRLLK